MEPAFEEIVARHLDELYQGALHLAGNRRDDAEELLLEMATNAARQFRRARPEDPEAFLDRELIRTFLKRPDRGIRDSDPGEAQPRLEGEGAEWALGALGALAPPIRAVIWLVVVRRRPYGQVAEFLQVDRQRVAGWVRDGHRQLFQAGAREPWRRESR